MLIRLIFHDDRIGDLPIFQGSLSASVKICEDSVGFLLHSKLLEKGVLPATVSSELCHPPSSLREEGNGREGGVVNVRSIPPNETPLSDRTKTSDVSQIFSYCMEANLLEKDSKRCLYRTHGMTICNASERCQLGASWILAQPSSVALPIVQPGFSGTAPPRGVNPPRCVHHGGSRSHASPRNTLGF